MRIVIVTDWFSEKMGYIENCLSKAFAELGQDVHIVTSNAQIYCNKPEYDDIYKGFLGPKYLQCGMSVVNGVKVHRLKCQKNRYAIRIKGLISKLMELNPDIVQTFSSTSLSSVEAAFGKLWNDYKLYTGNHDVASVFAPARMDVVPFVKKIRIAIRYTIPGAIVNIATEKNYAATIDAADISRRFYGVSSDKIEIAPLGVDTMLFTPNPDVEVKSKAKGIREEYGILNDEIMCVYTGRFTDGKNPLCLAKAIDSLIEDGELFKGLFIGDGPQAEDIKKCKGCATRPFMAIDDLPPYYYASDVCVWPRQESTSMLDAAAAGRPIVISERVQAIERVDGNGLVYIENDVGSLKAQLLKLKDKNLRTSLGEAGSKKMNDKFSWKLIANRRLCEYERALRG